MSLQSDIVTALAGIAGNRVYPDAAPADTDLPLVIYRVINKRPEAKLDSTVDLNNSIVAFESYAEDYQGALTLAGQVDAAIQAITPTGTLMYYPEAAPGEDYIIPTDDYMEPVFYGFWHN